MNTRCACLVLVLCCVLLAGCSLSSRTLEGHVPKKVDTFAQEFLNKLSKGDLDPASKLYKPSIAAADTATMLKEAAQRLAAGKLLATDLVSSRALVIGNNMRYDLTYQLQYPQSWLLVDLDVDVAGETGEMSATDIHLDTIPESLRTQNEFTIRGRPFVDYAALGVAVAVSLLGLFAFVVCLFTKTRAKWLWLLFILVGVFKWSINWSNGASWFEVRSVQLPWVLPQRAEPYAPWILSISLPVGALAFYLTRRLFGRARRAPEAPRPPAAPKPEPKPQLAPPPRPEPPRSPGPPG